MNPEDRQLIVAIGRAARRCAMYRELLEVARRYGDEQEAERLAGALTDADTTLADLINRALHDDEPAGGATAGDEPEA